ncbi:MAG TPA: acyl-[ACP]--phospholipid O-acyltransferase [Patescibacteria group bacterium]|nr:acyl-[ACP]--phospholipid O-acyltransferase [Patescibacteria group bacterium]
MSILHSRRFLPLFATQFLGAFNDNLFKTAMAMLITFRLATETSIPPQILVTIAGGVFILPFFLFSATAGQFADKLDRAQMARWVKVAEIGFMLLAAIGFLSHSLFVLFIVLFCMGVHSAFFGPVKYAILPQHLEGRELLSGNAYVEAGTFMAILLGTVAGGLLISHAELGEQIISAACVLVAIAGYAASRFIPPAPGPSPELVVNRNFWQETRTILAATQENTGVYRAILAISWFWLVGATYLTQFPAFAKIYLGGDESVVTLLLTLFSVGIACGSVLCSRLLKGQVQATYVPLAAIGMAAFGVDLYFAANNALPAGQVLATAGSFLAQPGSWRIVADLFVIALCGGMFVVPLYAIVQKRTDSRYMARMIAGLNIMNAMFMVASSIIGAVMLKAGASIPQIFLAMALMDILVAVYIVQLLPDALLRSICRAILGWAYKVEVRGMENFEKAGDRVLIIANHTSFLDAALIAAYLPVKVTFAVNTHIARAWWMKPLLRMVDAYPVDPTNPLALKSLIDVVKSGKTGMIFPEGRISVTGSLMKVYEGPGMIADKAGAKVLPIRIDGAQYTPFSRSAGKTVLRRFPKITLTILPPRDFVLPEGVFGRRRRQLAGAQLYDMMSQMVFDASDIDKPLLTSLMEASRLYGTKKIIAEDPLREPVRYRHLIARAMVLGRIMEKHLTLGAHATIPAVGVLLPNMVGTSIVFFALHAIRKVPAMINFSAGPAQVVSACQTALITTVITSRRFIEMGKMSPTIEAMQSVGVNFLYLEDLRAEIGFRGKLTGLLARYMPEMVDSFRRKASPHDPAVILFTSGSEGTPKGVVLSHRNIQSNRHQVASRVDFGPQDIVFNCLPMFHSFGLTGGTLLPILGGLRAFYYPSPLHYRIVPELIYDTNATILFGTDTFLAGYARFAHPYDFHAIRYVFAGAEKLKEETRRIYAEKYGVRIFEGYGATETAPVISINTPMHNRAGSVGRLMPGVAHRLEPVEGIDANAGKLVIQGPNVMLGYLKADAPGILQPPDGGWYDTGDIVGLDEDGFITIQGRMKRFAKIAGEMVSLSAVEIALQKLWPGNQHAVVSVKDDKKGEKLILFTTYPSAAPEAISAHFKMLGLSELSVPKKILISEIPVLGTGKTDYVRLQKMAAEA